MYCFHASGPLPTAMNQVAGAGLSWGSHISFIPASLGNRLPLRWLQALTGAGRVGPVIFATARPRQDVIDGQVIFGQNLTTLNSAGSCAAVNAGVSIPDQDAFAAPVRTPPRDIDVGAQGNH
jgi:hypothetical protein